MKLIEFKQYLNTLSDEYDELLVVNGEFGMDKDGNTFVMKNHEVMTVYVDINNSEIQLLHQTEKDVKDILFDIND